MFTYLLCTDRLPYQVKKYRSSGAQYFKAPAFSILAVQAPCARYHSCHCVKYCWQWTLFVLCSSSSSSSSFPFIYQVDIRNLH